MILGKESIIRRRYGAATVVGHELVPPAPVTSSILAGVQPLNGQETELVPEGKRRSDMRRIFTKSELRTANQHTQEPADEVVIDSIVYRVHEVSEYRSHLRHYEALVVRVDE